MDDVTAHAGDAEGSAPAGLRIGELSRRLGLTPAVLRAWERRYGVPRPHRTPAGQRLYDAADEARLRRMLSHIERGFSPVVAARFSGDPAPAGAGAGNGLEPLTGELRDALHAFDGDAAQRALDRLVAGYALDSVLRDAVLPVLRDLGDRWERRELTVGQEHFASALVGGRLHGLARGWDAGHGPRALLACPSGERHDLGLLCFGLALRERGWRVWFLGADTPVAEIRDGAALVAAELVVLGAVREGPLLDLAGTLNGLGEPAIRLCAGGRGATDAVARRLGAERLPDDPIAAADLVSAPSGA